MPKSGKDKEDANVPRPRAVPVFGYALEQPREGHWQKLDAIGRRAFVCGYCGAKTGSYEGWKNIGESGRVVAEIALCQNCNQPTYFAGGQVPGVPAGSPVEHVPEPLNALYEEARRSTAVGAYTGAVLVCRTLLMHIAVQKKAKPNQSFLDYVDFLVAEGYAPPNGKEWIDKIRKRGGGAAHDLPAIGETDANAILTFTEALLRFIYELPEKGRRA